MIPSRLNKKCQCSRAQSFWKLILVSITLMVQVSEAFSPCSFPPNTRFQKILSRRQPILHVFFEWEKSDSRSSLLTVKDKPIKKPLKVPSNEKAVSDLINLIQHKKKVPTVTTSDVAGNQDEKEMGRGILAAFATILLAAGVIGYNTFHLNPEVVVDIVQKFLHDPTSSLEAVVRAIDSMGPLGMLFFAVIYVVAEILAIPGFPLVASAGYLFGVVEGTALVLASAAIAASISFWIGRTALRTYVEDFLKDRPDLRKIDRAIEKQGFKLMLLLRLSPIFPFALSNYVYGASSVAFGNFFWGSLLGFFPGTLGYVYAGVVGKALTLGGNNVQPWYVYAGGFVLLSGFLKILADVATEIVNEIEDEDTSKT